MAGKRPRFTENFSTNLTSIEAFIGPHSRTAFRRFLDRLFHDIVPTLCRFPQSGRSFLSRAVKSTKAKVRATELGRSMRKEDELREVVVDDYLVLYLIRRDHVIFLAIKHHRQLSFDLKQFWSEG